MRAVNLLPAPRVETRQVDVESRARTTTAGALAAGLLVAFVIAAVGLAFVHERSAVNERRSTLDSLQAKVAQSRAAEEIRADRRSETDGHLAAITSAASGRTAWDGLLEQLARVMPPGTSLETLQANHWRRNVPDVDIDDDDDLHDDVEQARLEVVVLDKRLRFGDGRGTHRLRRHRPRGFAGDGRARARSPRAHPRAHRRNAPVDAASRKER